jgi:hypothetical protein
LEKEGTREGENVEESAAAWAFTQPISAGLLLD